MTFVRRTRQSQDSNPGRTPKCSPFHHPKQLLEVDQELWGQGSPPNPLKTLSREALEVNLLGGAYRIEKLGISDLEASP